jgi:hypothetical protein
MIPLELLRGFIYAIVLLAVFSGVKGGRKLNFAIAAALLYIPGAFLPLASSLVSSSAISAVAPLHMVEILADPVVYGYAGARLIGAKELLASGESPSPTISLARPTSETGHI